MTSYIRRMQNVRVGQLVSNCDELEVRLVPGEVFTLNGDSRGLQIVCETGKLWITQVDDPVDYVIKRGERFFASGTGKVVIQGVPHGKARVIAPSPVAF